MKRSSIRRLGGLLAGLLAGLTLLPSVAGAAPSSPARRWRVMVIIPETHLARPRIPDPAAETMINKILIDAGYKVVDQGRIKEIRYSAVMDRILKGGPNAAREAAQLGRKFGADLLVTGEALSQFVTQQQVETELGTVNRIRCKARVELKAIRMDTGEMVFADAAHRTGTPELTEELASKICLQQAAESLEESLLSKLDRLAYAGDLQVELEVRGIASVALAQQLEQTLSRLPGVLEVGEGDYDARTYSTELRLSRPALKGFAGKLETTPALKRFRLNVQSSSSSRIIANVR